MNTTECWSKNQHTRNKTRNVPRLTLGIDLHLKGIATRLQT